MKTIKQIADEIGVSKQAVFYRIRKSPLSNALQSLASKENGILMVSPDGEELIKQAFSTDKLKTPSNTSFDGVYQQLIDSLQRQIDVYKAQLEVKDKQIEELTLTVREQAESVKAAQALHGATMQKLLAGGDDGADERPATDVMAEDFQDERKKKRGFWKKS